MKLLLLHGPAVTNSRAKLLQIRRNFSSDEVVVFDKWVDQKQVVGSIFTTSLLSSQRLFVWENPPESFSLPEKFMSDDSLVFWFDKEIDSRKPIYQLVKQKGQVLFFDEAKEVSVFPWLDLLAAKDKKAFIKMEELKRVGFDSQYFITMIFYLLRSLIAPNKTSPSFVKQKLQKQRQNFSNDDLANLYKFVLETDFKIKSGLLEPSQANFLLVQKFIF